MKSDEKYMKMAIELASRAEGMTSPNPIVGAIIVKKGKIVGKGYHKEAGLPHAEINALKEAGNKAKGATLYVTLEPCDHYGRTPPCTRAIIKSGVRRVVAGMIDPNPINSRRGFGRLRESGVKTKIGVLKKEAESINKSYIKFITKRMPYVTIKIAESLDGKIATKRGDSKWITSKDSRRYVHELRAKSDAVMVGLNTVIKDDPLLLSRSSRTKQPIRIVVDGRLKTPLNSNIFSSTKLSPVIIATSKKSPKIKSYEKKGAEVLIVKPKGKRVDLKDLLSTLARKGVSNILVEGGGELNASLIEEKLADKFLFFIAPKIIGGRDAKTSVEGEGVDRICKANIVKNFKVRRFANDILIEADLA